MRSFLLVVAVLQLETAVVAVSVCQAGSGALTSATGVITDDSSSSGA